VEVLKNFSVTSMFLWRKQKWKLKKLIKFFSCRVQFKYSGGKWMPSSRLSAFFQMLISQDSQKRLLCQFPLVREIIYDPQAIEWPERKQCCSSTDFCGCFWLTAFWCSFSREANLRFVEPMFLVANKEQKKLHYRRVFFRKGSFGLGDKLPMVW